MMKMKKTALAAALLLMFALAGCVGSGDSVASDVPDGATAVTVAWYDRAGEKEETVYTGREDIDALCALLKAIEPGEQAALEPSPEETVEMTVSSDGGESQTYVFNDGCIQTEDGYCLAENLDALTASEYWPAP